MTGVDVDSMLLARRVRPAPQPAPTADRPEPLTSGQQTLWRGEHGEPRGGVSPFVLLFRWRSPVDRGALNAAVSALHRRHPALRTTFAASEGEVWQRVGPPRPVVVPCQEVPSGPAAPLRLRATADALAAEPFQLGQEPPVRWRLLRVASTGDVLLCCLHHLVADAASVPVLHADLARFYRRAAGAPPPDGDQPPASRSVMPAGSVAVEAANLRAWCTELRGAPAALPLPFDREPDSRATYDGATFSAEVPADLVAAVWEVARQEGIGPLAAVTALFALLLGRQAGREDVVVGTLLSARDRPELDGVVGYLTDLVPLRLDLGGPVSLRELVRRGRAVLLRAMQHRAVPFETIWRAAGTPLVPGRPPLVQVLCLIEEPPSGADTPQDPTVEQLPASRSSVDLGMTLVTGDRPTCVWEYRRELFEPATVRLLHERFVQLLWSAAADPDRALMSFSDQGVPR